MNERYCGGLKQKKKKEKEKYSCSLYLKANWKHTNAYQQIKKQKQINRDYTVQNT